MNERTEEVDLEYKSQAYTGQQRLRDLQDDETEELEARQANQSQEAQSEPEENLDPEEQTYKKRYGDLRTHLNNLTERHREEIRRMQEQIDTLSKKEFKLPKSEEELQEFAKQYPDVYKVVESVALKYANEATKTLEKEVLDVRKQALIAAREKAEAKLLKLHPDFDEIRQDPAFHEWAKMQPQFVQDALYKNETDHLAAARAIDLYKADVGITTKKTRSKKETAKEAASHVPAGRSSDPTAFNDDIIKESQVAKMSQHEYELNEERIFKAIRAGKFVYDLSGAAR